MKKYRCPKCGEVFKGEIEECPKCHVKLHYKSKEKVHDEGEAKIVEKFNFDSPDIIKHDDKIPETPLIENEEDEIKKPAPTPQESQQLVIGDSFFDGRLYQKIGKLLLGGLLVLVTAGIAFPWAVCIYYRWEYKHMVIQGHRLKFTGKGGQLFGRYLLWFLLMLLTAFIFSLWVAIFVQKWKIKHVEFAD